MLLLEFKLWLEGQHEDLALKILNNNQHALAQLHVIPKFLPSAAYFLAQGQNPNTINQYFNKVKELDDKKKITVNYTKDGINVDGKIVNWLQFTEIVDGKINLTKPKQQNDVTNVITDKPIIDVNNIKIYESHSPQKCIKYGQGYSFCISRPGNTMWQSYRDFQTSTFYFVLDENRPKTDPLHIVVVDIAENGVQLTDANNTTGSIAEFYEDHEKYFEYLRSKGIDTSIFKNIPKSEEEEKEQKLFGNRNRDLNWFVKLPYDYKSKYIGRGHKLTNEQFDYLWENNVVKLLQQYISTGRLLKNQLDKIFSVNQFKKSYLNARLIAMEHGELLIEKEFKELNEEQQKLAVKQNGLAIRFVENPSEELQLAAVSQNGSAINHIKNPSEQVQLAAINQNGLAIQFIENPSEQVQLAAVKQYGNAIESIKNPSKQVQLTAVIQNPHAINHIKNPSEEVQLTAVRKNGSAIACIENPNEKVQLTAIDQNPYVIKYIKNPSEKVRLAANH